MKTRSYEEFSASLYRTASNAVMPLRVMVELTYRCNFRCHHCYVPKDYAERYRPKEMATKEVFSLLEELRALGCFYLGITGGEPFLRKDILGILRYAAKLGFEVLVYTNGSLIDAKAARALGRIRLNKVDITLPGWTPGVFDALTGVKGSRRKVYRGIELLLKNHVPVEFKTCLLDTNRHEAPMIKAFARSHGARLRLSDKFDMKLGDDKVTKSQGHKVTSACGAGRTQAAVTPAGELKMCLLMDDERIPIFKKTLAPAWHKLVQKAARVEAGACASCFP